MVLRTIARPLLSVVFIGQGLDSLRNPPAAGEAARPALDGLRKLPPPVAEKVPADTAGIERVAMFTAVVQIGAGALLASGKLPRVSAAVLAATVLPSRLGAHAFWNEDDPELKREQRREFLTDVSLLGGLMIASADTAGKPSLGWRGRRAAERVSAALAAVASDAGSGSLLHDSDLGERLAHSVQLGVERGREMVSTATEKSAPVVDAARQRGRELAETAREHGAELVAATRRLSQSVG